MNSRPFDEWLTARCGPNISPDARALAERIVRAGFLFNEATRVRWGFRQVVSDDLHRLVVVRVRRRGGQGAKALVRRVVGIEAWESTRVIATREPADIDAWLDREAQP